MNSILPSTISNIAHICIGLDISAGGWGDADDSADELAPTGASQMLYALVSALNEGNKQQTLKIVVQDYSFLDRRIFYPLAKLRDGVKTEVFESGRRKLVGTWVNEFKNELKDDPILRYDALQAMQFGLKEMQQFVTKAEAAGRDENVVYDTAFYARNRLEEALYEWETGFFTVDSERYIRKVMRFVTAVMELPEVPEAVGVPADVDVREEWEVLVRERLGRIEEDEVLEV